MTKNIDESENQLSDLQRTKGFLDSVVERKRILDLVSQDKLTDIQKLWLLAFEASETKIAKMGSEQTESSKEDFVRSMIVLNNTISYER